MVDNKADHYSELNQVRGDDHVPCGFGPAKAFDLFWQRFPQHAVTHVLDIHSLEDPNCLMPQGTRSRQGSGRSKLFFFNILDVSPDDSRFYGDPANLGICKLFQINILRGSSKKNRTEPRRAKSFTCNILRVNYLNSIFYEARERP